MKKHSAIITPLVLGTAATIAMSAVSAPKAMAEVKWTSSLVSCGSKYPSGHTSGYTTVWVNAAGGYASRTFEYPGGTVSAVGTSHNGYITSDASARITSWGSDGCSLQ